MEQLKVLFKCLGWVSPKGGKEQLVELEKGSTLRDLLCSRLHEEDLIRMLKSDGGLSSKVIVLVNGRDSRLFKKLDTELREDDIITIVPVVHGG